MKPKVLRGIQVVLAMSILSLGYVSWSQGAEGPTVRQVVMKDGRVIQGVVKRTEAGVEIRTGVDAVTTVKLADVAEIRDVVSGRDTYLEKRKATDARKPEALYEIARWAWENGRDDVDVLRLAEEDLTAALKLKPDYLRATLLLPQVRARVAELAGNAPKPDGPATTVLPKTILDEYLVSEADIGWIRLAEMGLKEKGVRIKFENKVLQRYIDAMKGSKLDNWDRRGKEERFRRTPPLGQLQEIIQNRPEDWDLLKDIHIKSEPAFMLEFRKLWPLIERNCASTECHGGAEPRGGLKFFVAPGRSDRMMYTNYVIVSGFRKGGRSLVDRQDPDQSLLLQYGLDKQVSKRPHPGDVKVRLFADKRDRSYRRMDAWIKSLRGPLHPDYHLQWKAPFKMDVDTSGKADLQLNGGEK